ncbi:MAG: hypothetical protein JNM81_01755 [Rhodospirillaceae bacterium]|nr:hypothetical protein [Rhodospirillaceae bacterium]
MSDSAIIAFYRGHGTDHAGRRMADILAWDHRRLEMVHDYIQWLFPLPEASRFNPDAPLLSAADKAEFRASPELQAKVLQSLDVMLGFYGLARTPSDIQRGPVWQSTQHWLAPLNHNHLRLTRILLFLGHIGLPDVAAQLLKVLNDIAVNEGHKMVSPRTLSFWHDAVPR